MRNFVLCVLATFVSIGANASTITSPEVLVDPITGVQLTIDNPNLFGDPGSTVGWDFSIENATPYWINFTSSALFGNIGLGIPRNPYSDLISWEGGPDAGFIDPGTSWTESFDPNTGLGGIGTFSFASDAAPGAFEGHTLDLTYDYFQDNNGAPGDQAGTSSFDPGVTLNVESQLSAEATTPEPLTSGLIGAGLIVIGGIGRRARRKRG